VVEYGLGGQCASIRSFETPPDFAALMEGKEHDIFPRMEEVARRCIEEDGADVICLGSTTMHQAAEYLASTLPVPVINPGPLTYKLAEAFLALDLTHSRKAYREPPVVESTLFADMARGGAAWQVAHGS
jgi:allantoin racemase